MFKTMKSFKEPIFTDNLYIPHILHYRIINFNRLNVSCRPVSCWKKAVYQDTFVKTEETSTYQELDLSDSAYQNTTIRGHT